MGWNEGETSAWGGSAALSPVRGRRGVMFLLRHLSGLWPCLAFLNTGRSRSCLHRVPLLTKSRIEGGSTALSFSPH